MKFIDVDKIAHILAPFNFDTLISCKGIDGPGNWLIEFFTAGDSRVALINEDGFVVWCHSTGGRDRDTYALDLIWQYENHPHLNLAPMDADALMRERGLARLRDPELGPTDGYEVFIRLYERMSADAANVKELIDVNLVAHGFKPDDTPPICQTVSAAEDARAALGAAAALGGSNLPAKAPEALESAGNGVETISQAIVEVIGQTIAAANTELTAQVVAEIADRIHADPAGIDEEDTDVAIAGLEAYFQWRGASFTKMWSGDNNNGFRLWQNNHYIGSYEGDQGIIDIALAREADKALTVYLENN